MTFERPASPRATGEAGGDALALRGDGVDAARSLAQPARAKAPNASATTQESLGEEFDLDMVRTRFEVIGTLITTRQGFNGVNAAMRHICGETIGAPDQPPPR